MMYNGGPVEVGPLLLRHASSGGARHRRHEMNNHMHSSMPMQTTRRFSIIFTIVAGLVLGGVVEAAPVTLLAGRCEVTVPEGWHVEAKYADTGVVIQPPDPRAWPVEIAAWAAPDGAEQSAEAAAAAHEAVLRRQYPYTRTSSEPLTGGDRLAGVLVTGRIATGGGQEVASLFAAFSRAGRYYVVGTFAVPDHADRTIERHLRPVLGGLQIRQSPLQQQQNGDETTEEIASEKPGATPDAPAVPPQVPETPQQSQTETPEESAAIGGTEAPVGPEYDTEPATVPSQSAPDVPLFELTDAPLSVRAPADWTIEAANGRWTVHPEGMEQTALGVLIWPLAVSGSHRDAGYIAREALKHWSPTAGYDLQIRAEGSSAVIISGVGLGPGGPLRVLGFCRVAGDRALLSAMYVASRRSAKDWPTLTRILASIRVDSFDFAEPHYAPPTHDWTLPGAPEVTLQVPEGYRIRGELDCDGPVDALTIETVDPGPDRMYITVHQPVVPLFKGLSQLLVGLGYDAGDRYRSEATGQQYTLLSRMDPEEFILEYSNAESRISLRTPEIIASEKTRAARRLLTSADASGRHVVVEGDSRLGRRRHHYLVATGGINTGDASTWQAAVIEAAAPVKKEHHILAAARILLESADIDPTGSARQIAAANLLRRAAEAVADFPRFGPPPMKGLFSPLSHTDNGAEWTWRPPERSTATWEDLVDSLIYNRDITGIIPEVELMQTPPEGTATQR